MDWTLGICMFCFLKLNLESQFAAGQARSFSWPLVITVLMLDV